jgi:HK97 family phage portal protein
MSFWRNILEATGLQYRAEGDPAPSYIAPAPRDSSTLGVSQDQALSVSTVYRAVQILTTAASQLSLRLERNGTLVPADQVPSLIKQPSLGMSRSEFVEQVVTSLAVSGNSYWLLNRPTDGTVANIDLLNPYQVHVSQDKQGRRWYHHNGTKYPAADIKHLSLLKLPGKLTGLGPIQAARIELRGALDLRDYAATWFTTSGIPNGILSSDQVLTAEDAKTARERWNGTEENPVDNKQGVRVLGKGLKYSPILLNPADAQWLQNQQFTTTQIARLFGTPASLMLAAVEGNSQTYSNVEQDWIAFTRFTLMGYLRKIEEALTDLVVRGQTVRFNIETLLRTDTKTRYEAHAIAAGRWLTVDEIRSIENLPPLSAAQRQELKDATPAPTSQEATA